MKNAVHDWVQDAEHDVPFEGELKHGSRRNGALHQRRPVQAVDDCRSRGQTGKGGKDRETIAADEVVSIAETVVQVSDRTVDDAMSDVSTRSLRTWVGNTAHRLADRTEDHDWRHLSTHDLRERWATLLAPDFGVDPMLICDRGGWAALEMVFEQYRGSYSSSVQRRHLALVPWISPDIDVNRGDIETPREISGASESNKPRV